MLFEQIIHNTQQFGYSCDVSDGDLQLEVDVPGANKDNLTIDYSDNDSCLLVSYPRKGKDEKAKFYVRKAYSLKDASATVNDGVLRLTIPRKEQQKTRIQVT